MITYKCSRCGNLFKEHEIIVDTWTENRGEYFGMPAFETVSEDHCPYCNSTDIDEYWEDE